MPQHHTHVPTPKPNQAQQQPYIDRPSSPPGGSGEHAARLRRDLDAALARLPGLQGVLPGSGSPDDRARVLALVADLERAAPFDPAAPGAEASLLGTWQLVFASDGTVVTRTPLAQALASLPGVPGFGLSDIRQELREPAGAPAGAGASCENCVRVGLGPLGTWDVKVTGHWLTTHAPGWRFSGGDWAQGAAAAAAVDSSGSGSSGSGGGGGSGGGDPPGLASEVAFDGFGVRLAGLFGLDLPLPELKLAAPRRPARARPNWRTTYCDGAVRVGRGVESKGVFVFRRQQTPLDSAAAL